MKTSSFLELYNTVSDSVYDSRNKNTNRGVYDFRVEVAGVCIHRLSNFTTLLAIAYTTAATKIPIEAYPISP